MQSAACSSPVTVSPESLAAAFAAVPDPRRAASVTYPLAAILTLALSAILANHRSVLAIAEWGARQSPGPVAHAWRRGRPNPLPVNAPTPVLPAGWPGLGANLDPLLRAQRRASR